MVVRAVPLKRKKRPSKQQERASLPSPVSNISKIGSLNRYTDKDAARDLLHEAAILVAPIIHAHRFKVGTLCEMFPKNPNLLGLNVNHGQKILIRLRFHSNDKQFYPMCDIVDTFLHELTHNVHGPHDEKFYSLLDKLKKEFDQSRYTTTGSKDYRCEQQKLGRAGLTNGFVSIRAQRIKALSKASKFKSESRVLGQGTDLIQGMPTTRQDFNGHNPRELALQAAERRLNDSKWCSKAEESDSVAPAAGDVEIVDLTDDANPISKKSKLSEYASIVDLTCDEIGDTCSENEIITIDACEAPPKSILKNPGRKRGNEGRKVNFKDERPDVESITDTQVHGLSTPTAYEGSTVIYTSSKSSRAYFGDEQQYPRRKVVASLNFTQILKSSWVDLELLSQDKTAKPVRKPRAKKKSKATVARKPLDKREPKPKAKRSVKSIKSAEPKAAKSTPRMKQPQKTVKDISFSDLF